MRRSSLALLPAVASLIAGGGCGLIFNYEGYQETGSGGNTASVAGTSSGATGGGGGTGATGGMTTGVTSSGAGGAIGGSGGAGGGLFDSAIWIQQMAGDQPQAVNDVRVRGNSVWIAGTYYDAFSFAGTNFLKPSGPASPFVARLDSTGAMIWNHADLPTGLPPCESGLTSIAPMADNTFYAAGYCIEMSQTRGIALRGSGQAPTVLGEAGSVTGGATDHRLKDVALSTSDIPLFVGNAGDGTLLFKEVPAVGQNTDADIGVVSCLDAACTSPQVQVLGAQGSADVVANVALDSNGTAFITGSYQKEWANTDLEPTGGMALDTPYVVSFGMGGGWERSFLRSSTSNESCDSVDFGPSSGRAIAVDKIQNVVVAGVACYSMVFEPGGQALPIGGKSDLFLAKLNKDGTTLWAKIFGDGENQVPTAVEIHPVTNNIFVAGFFSGTLDFKNGIVLSGGSSGLKIFVVEFDQDGVALAARAFGAGMEPLEVRRLRLALNEEQLFLAGSWKTDIAFGNSINFAVEPGQGLNGFVVAFQK